MMESPSARVSRAVVGVLSIWCLGCTSLDIIIDRLVHGDAPIGGCVIAEDVPSPAQPSSNGAPTVQPSPEHSAAVGCGCDHCIAVQSPASAVAVLPHPTPDNGEQRFDSVPDVYREPLVPPPIARTI